MRMRMLVVGAVLVMALPATCLGVCGDGIVDPGEQCDAGGNNDYGMCCSSSCTGIDADGDGICDAVDTCDWRDIRPARLTEIVLRVSGLANRPGDERFRLLGRIRIPDDRFVDPAIAGFRFGMFSWVSSYADPKVGTSPLVSATVPGGRGWRTNPDRGIWTFRDGRGAHGGITKVTLKRFDPDPIIESAFSSTFAFEIVGRRGRYAITPEMVAPFTSPFQAEPWGQVWMEVGLADGGPCNERLLPFGGYPDYSCTFSPNGNVLVCSDPAPMGPCHVGDPLDLTVCEVQAVARAEEAYHAQTGEYFAGACADLPGYVLTDPGYSYGLSCAVDVFGTQFRVAIANPRVVGGCYYDSAASPPVSCW
jgi:hypothetical protein